MPEYLFVYGTLRQCAQRRAAGNRCYQLLQQHASLLGQGRLQAKLYLVDYYPGAVPSTDVTDQVSGELYLLSQPEFVLPLLDKYEECGPGFAQPQEYRREQQSVIMENGDTVIAWVYVYNRSTDRLRLIKGGDFLADKVTR
tara:strand:+ start:3460 stop:3882 length:423 start_codon:yes stop_codon:yes gene_type:complete